jgi:DNA-binding winged helix-turn-helix (wHTH) protein
LASSSQVLTLLLERPGDLVTRDELRQRLWPNGKFGDFDHGLNAVINRLRENIGRFGRVATPYRDAAPARVPIRGPG